MTPSEAVTTFRNARCIAVVGASRNPRKYGYKVFYHLERAGYEVYAVNPNCETIGSHPCHPDFHSLPVKPEAAVFITEPEVTTEMVKQALEYGVRCIWMQPGAVSAEAIALAEDAGAKTVHGRCVLVTI